MNAEAKRLVCTNHECRAEIIIVKKPPIEKQNLRCACGSELKKIYHAPRLTVVGTLSRKSRQSKSESADTDVNGFSFADKND